MTEIRSDTPQPAPTVCYDGACPLCQAEISLYKNSGAEAQFTDVSQENLDLDPTAPSQEALLKRFHIHQADGRWISGFAAFCELWKVTPGWRWLGRLCAHRPLVWLGEGLYRAFLVIRPALQFLARGFQKQAP